MATSRTIYSYDYRELRIVGCFPWLGISAKKMDPPRLVLVYLLIGSNETTHMIPKTATNPSIIFKKLFLLFPGEPVLTD